MFTVYRATKGCGGASLRGIFWCFVQRLLKMGLSQSTSDPREIYTDPAPVRPAVPEELYGARWMQVSHRRAHEQKLARWANIEPGGHANLMRPWDSQYMRRIKKTNIGRMPVRSDTPMDQAIGVDL